MAKDKKPKKPKKPKGIQDPRIEERKVEATSANQAKIEEDIKKYAEEKVDRPTRVYATRKLRKKAAASNTEQTATRASELNLGNLEGMEEGATATSGYISAESRKASQERLKSGEGGVDTSQADPDEVKAAAELMAKQRAEEKEPDISDEEFERRHKEKMESGQFDEARAKLEAERQAREAEEASRRAQGQIIGGQDIQSDVGTKIEATGVNEEGVTQFQEVFPTPGEERRRDVRSPRLKTGIFDPGQSVSGVQDTATPGRLSEKKATEKVERVKGIAEDDPIFSLARSIRAEELMDEGISADPDKDLSNLALSGTPAHTKAIVLHHTGLTHDQLKSYLGPVHNAEADVKLDKLHENVMRFVRSSRKNDFASDMGLIRGEDGKLVKSGKGFATTPVAETQYWQHPTETDEKGMPKVYKVSEMHPDMIKELSSSWGGYRSENAVQGVKNINGEDVAVEQHFGHHKHPGTGTWRFTKPPANFDDSNSISANAEAVLKTTGILPNAIAHISRAIAGVPERFKKNRGKSKADELVEAMGGKRRAGSRKVPMPGFSNGEQLETIYHDEGPKALSIEDLPGTFDEHGNPVALPPRAGVGGTGRSVLVRRGPSMRDAFRGPAAESADTLKTLTTPESYDTPIEKKGDVFVAGVSSEDQEKDALSQANERLSGILRANRERAAIGQQFRGAPEKAPQQLAFGEKASLNEGEDYDIDKDFTTYGGKDKIVVTPGKPAIDVVEGPIEGWQHRMDQETLASGDRLGMAKEPGFGRVRYAQTREVQTNLGRISTNVASPAKIERIHTGEPDQQVLRARAEAEAGRSASGTSGKGAGEFVTSDYKPEEVMQPTLDFNPRSDSNIPKSKQFLGGTVRALTEAESNVENIGANTERGMNPPASLFAVGANTPTAAPSTVAAPLQTPRGDEPIKKSKAKGKDAGKPLERIVNGQVFKVGGKQKFVRNLSRPAGASTGIRANEVQRNEAGISRDLLGRLDDKNKKSNDTDQSQQ